MNSILNLFSLIIFSIIFLTSGLVTGQESYFFDRNWNQIFKTKEKKNAKYFRKVEQVEGGIYLQSDYYVDKKRTPAAVKYFKDRNLSLPVNKHITYYKSGKIKSVGAYDFGAKTGNWTYYWPNSKIREEGNFNQDVKNGKWTRKKKNGKLWAEENYSMGELHGTQKEYWDNGNLKALLNFDNGVPEAELTSYYEDGSVLRKEVYNQGKLIEKACYTKTGQDTTYFVYFVSPRFPGCEEDGKHKAAIRACAINKMNEFIQNNLQYPDAARIYGKQGTVLLNFTVTKEGKLKDPVLLEDISEEVAYECLRLFYRFPDWIPGKKDGIVDDIHFEIPLLFQLN